MNRAKAILRWFLAAGFFLALVFLWSLATSGTGPGVLAWSVLMAIMPFAGGVALLGVVGYVLCKRAFSLPLLLTTLAALLAIWPYVWRFGWLAVAYPVSIERMRPAATVRLPADEPLLVAWGGDRVRTNYHVTYPNQRWAYDLVVEPALTGSDRLEAYGCWGVTVAAPAAGQVVLVHDDEPDEVPGRDSEGYALAEGNHIGIRLSTGTYLMLGHLQQGSLQVEAGDWVAEGQALGKCGNSGSTSEPHIHIHHQRQDPTTHPLDLAEGLPLYFRDHGGPAMPEGGFHRENGQIVPLGPVVLHRASPSLDH